MSYGLITPEQLRLRLDIGETPVMIDVRQPEEHQEIHIPNSILIPLDTLPSRIEELEHFKEHEIILYCRSGGRSGKACEYLYARGFNVLNLVGGMLEWKA
ncbi:MAG: rhodanese-like domain-containing protein [Ignavibacteriae bacterium]|jgi:rhodanese-related sulfurtransferase|nr:rhodanese-like domain-containing protein [Ignavibacteriota bacterium]